MQTSTNRRGVGPLQAVTPGPLRAVVPNPRLSGDKGIDGRMMLSHDPVQVKQSNVGRPMIDNFETVIE
ncbi:MAG: hypothetical protein LC790_13955, partial [Actinobacteria bacterium]|nr:hypothetical protein [Actinomycetota bacterium]